jgi:hypothetical protein
LIDPVKPFAGVSVKTTPDAAAPLATNILAVHGVIDNPLDHRDPYPPLYSVLFEVGEVFGGSSRDKLSVDVHEEWLEPAG